MALSTLVLVSAVASSQQARADSGGDEVVPTGPTTPAAGYSTTTRGSAVAGAGFITFDPGNGYVLRDLNSYTVQLLSGNEGDVEQLRSVVTAAAAQIAQNYGTHITVASGTVPNGSPDSNPTTGQILLGVDSSTPCGTGDAGCGGPTYGASNPANATQLVTGGRTWIYPVVLGYTAAQKQHVVDHELGHALGLDHYNTTYNGANQVMNASSYDAPNYQGGDLNGLHYLRGDQAALAIRTSDGHVFAKDSDITGALVDLGGYFTSVVAATDLSNGLFLGAVGGDGHGYVRQGIAGTWIDVGSGVKAISVATDPVSGPTIAVTLTNGHVLAKSGNIYNTWTDEGGYFVNASVATAPNTGFTLITLGGDGHAYVKTNINGAYTDEDASVASVSAASDATNGRYIAVTQNDGTILVKHGDPSSAWVNEGGSFASSQIATDPYNGPVIAAMGNDGHGYVKQGLGGQYVDESSGLNSISISTGTNDSLVIGAITSSGQAMFKQKSIGGAWDTEGPTTTTTSVAVAG